jgi:hypothetical protein
MSLKWSRSSSTVPNARELAKATNSPQPASRLPATTPSSEESGPDRTRTSFRRRATYGEHLLSQLRVEADDGGAIDLIDETRRHLLGLSSATERDPIACVLLRLSS